MYSRNLEDVTFGYPAKYARLWNPIYLRYDASIMFLHSLADKELVAKPSQRPQRVGVPGMSNEFVELCCLECGFTETLAAAPEWIQGDPYACPRCNAQSWALAPSEGVPVAPPGHDDPQLAANDAARDQQESEPKIICRRSSPVFPRRGRH